MSSRWRRSSPQELMGWLAAVDVPWGIAGGWALDLWQGTVSREHSDIEIACYRADLPRLLPMLDGFEIAIARNKVLTPYRSGETLPDETFSLWLRRHGETLWDFEIVAEAQRDRQWVYRRDASVGRPVNKVFVRAGEFPVIAPKSSSSTNARNRGRRTSPTWSAMCRRSRRQPIAGCERPWRRRTRRSCRHWRRCGDE